MLSYKNQLIVVFTIFAAVESVEAGVVERKFEVKLAAFDNGEVSCKPADTLNGVWIEVVPAAGQWSVGNATRAGQVKYDGAQGKWTVKLIVEIRERLKDALGALRLKYDNQPPDFKPDDYLLYPCGYSKNGKSRLVVDGHQWPQIVYIVPRVIEEEFFKQQVFRPERGCVEQAYYFASLVLDQISAVASGDIEESYGRQLKARIESAVRTEAAYWKVGPEQALQAFEAWSERTSQTSQSTAFALTGAPTAEEQAAAQAYLGNFPDSIAILEKADSATLLRANLNLACSRDTVFNADSIQDAEIRRRELEEAQKSARDALKLLNEVESSGRHDVSAVKEAVRESVNGWSDPICPPKTFQVKISE